MSLASIFIEQIIVLIAHAVSGIYSSDLKYNKKITWCIWSIWIVLQEGLWCF